jgi:hypothetical protein
MLDTVDPGHRDQVTSAELVTLDQQPNPATGIRTRTGRQLGRREPVNLYDVSAIRLLGDRPGQALEASTAPK